jgi:AcrR family transcriptional regulator
MTQATSTSASLARPMRADARRNYARLIEAARESFRDSDADTSLEAIAARAGVGIGTLYRHFPNRLALLESVYRDEVDALDARTQERLAAGDPWEGLGQWLRDFVDYATTKRALFHELIDAVGRDSELLTHSRAVIEQSVEAVLSRAQQAGVAKPEITGGDLLRLVGGCTMMPGSTEEQRERMLEIVLAGVRA